MENREVCKNEFIIPLGPELIELYKDDEMKHSLRSLQTESVRPQLRMTDIVYVYIFRSILFTLKKNEGREIIIFIFKIWIIFVHMNKSIEFLNLTYLISNINFIIIKINFVTLLVIFSKKKKKDSYKPYFDQ